MLDHHPIPTPPMFPVLPPGLAVLFEEMQALMGILPALGAPADPSPAARDAEIEAGFDNMPV